VGWKGNIKFDRLSDSKRRPGDSYGNTSRPQDVIIRMRCWIKDAAGAPFRQINYYANRRVKSRDEASQTSNVNLHADILGLESHQLICYSEYILFDAMVLREGYKNGVKEIGLVANSDLNRYWHNTSSTFRGGEQEIHPLRTFSASELGLMIVYETKRKTRGTILVHWAYVASLELLSCARNWL
jgi:hypothetical protein